MPRRKKKMTPDQREAKGLGWNSVKIFKFRKAAEKFAAEYTANPEMPIKDVLALARAVMSIHRVKYWNCEQCSRHLSTRQCYMPCIFCGHNNYKLVEKVRKKRAKEREEENLRLLEQEEPQTQEYGFNNYW